MLLLLLLLLIWEASIISEEMYSIGVVDVVEHICGDETKIKLPPPPLLLLLLSFTAELFAVGVLLLLFDVVVTIAAATAAVDDVQLTMRMVDAFKFRPAPFVTTVVSSVLPTMSRVRFGTRP